MARGRRRNRRKEQVPGWIWMLAGFSLGLVVALGIYLTERLPSPGSARQGLATVRPAAEPVGPVPAASRAPANTEPAVQPTPTEATEFEFYDVLPEFEVVVPDSGEELRADPSAIAEERSGNYIVQAGAFRTAADAERMKARLALFGFESQIQRVAIDTDVYHRVRIGPVRDLGELNRIRRQLREERIDYLLIDTPE